MKRKGQTWSMDLIIAVIIFVLVITIFYALLVKEPKKDVLALKQEGVFIGEKLSNNQGTGSCAFLDKKQVDPIKLQECFNSSSADFKKENNIKNKFCIYFVDQKGRIITVENQTGFGYSDIIIGDTPCGKKITP